MHMEMPKPSEEHRRLEALAGTWVGDETLYPSPWEAKGGKATGRSTGRIDLDGFWLVTDYAQERDGRVTFRGHGVYGWDAREQRYLMYWFDSATFGAIQPVRGIWEGNRLVFSREQGEDGVVSRYVYELEGRDAYRFRIERSADGKDWKALLEISFVRAG